VRQTLAIRSQEVRCFPPLRWEKAQGWGTRLEDFTVIAKLRDAEEG
jgi:hypothetical protein